MVIITLNCSDGKFTVEREVAINPNAELRSMLLAEMLEDDVDDDGNPVDAEIPLGFLTVEHTRAVFDFVQRVILNPIPELPQPIPSDLGALAGPEYAVLNKRFKDKEDFFLLARAADYLDVNGLLVFMGRYIASAIKGKSLEEAKIMFGVVAKPSDAALAAAHATALEIYDQKFAMIAKEKAEREAAERVARAADREEEHPRDEMD